MATRSSTNTAPASNGAVAVPPRASVTETAPKRASAGRPSADYSGWTTVIEELRSDCPKFYNYEDVENVQALARGLRKTFGVIANTRGVSKTTKRGNLSIGYPADEDGNPDEGEAAKTIAKFAEYAH